MVKDWVSKGTVFSGGVIIFGWTSKILSDEQKNKLVKDINNICKPKNWIIKWLDHLTYMFRLKTAK